jgi:hypothetical protein
MMNKILNKERAGCRGPKMRYNVWRAKHNQYWETVYKIAVEIACKDHKLDIDEIKVNEKRAPWEKTLNKLKDEGKSFRSVSWKWLMEQVNDEEFYGKQP